MIDKNNLAQLKELVEKYSEPSGLNTFDATYLKVNDRMIRICSSLLSETTEGIHEETDLLILVLRALSSLIILTQSPLIPTVIERSKVVLHKLRPSLRKAELYTYLYCFDQEDEYRDGACQIINRLKEKSQNSVEEQHLIHNFNMITSVYNRM
jgi:hypothetical protein